MIPRLFTTLVGVRDKREVSFIHLKFIHVDMSDRRAEFHAEAMGSSDRNDRDSWVRVRVIVCSVSVIRSHAR